VVDNICGDMTYAVVDGYTYLFIFIYLFIQFINQQWHRSTVQAMT